MEMAPMEDNSIGMFNESLGSGSPDLLTYLETQYKKHLEEALEERRQQGVPAVASVEKAVQQAPATHFLTWAKKFLTETPAVENYMTMGEVGIRLANGQLVTISPNTQQPGTMQRSVSVPFTKPKRTA